MCEDSWLSQRRMAGWPQPRCVHGLGVGLVTLGPEGSQDLRDLRYRDAVKILTF